jgi:hypothetical protein
MSAVLDVRLDEQAVHGFKSPLAARALGNNCSRLRLPVRRQWKVPVYDRNAVPKYGTQGVHLLLESTACWALVICPDDKCKLGFFRADASLVTEVLFPAVKFSTRYRAFV